MPWLSLPFGYAAIKSLCKYFDVQGIPCLVIIGPDGKTVINRGRNLINLYQENAYPQLPRKEMDEGRRTYLSLRIMRSVGMNLHWHWKGLEEGLLYAVTVTSRGLLGLPVS
ncbi:hypothetical protein SLE2022_258590 [Rubroshorea leprosula]